MGFGGPKAPAFETCGYTRNNEGYKKCGQCGKPPKEEAPTGPRKSRSLTGVGKKAAPKSGKFVSCDNCGAQNLKGYKLCSECFAPPFDDDGDDSADLSFLDK